MSDVTGRPRSDVFEDVPLRVEPAQRHVLREVLECRARGEPDQLGLGHLGALAHVFDDVAQRHRVVVVHVRGHLRPVAVVQVQAERPHAGQATTGLPQAGGDVLRHREVVRHEIHVEGHERPAGRRQDGARRRVRRARAVIGDELARLDPARELLRAAAPDPRAFGVLRPRGELPVEEHRHAQLLANQRRRGEHLADRCAVPLLVQVHHGHHVERADVRVDSRVRADVDARHRGASPVEERLGHLPLAGRQGEDGAVVIRVRVKVEEARGRKRPPDRLERGEIAPLADIGHGHEQRPVVHALKATRQPLNSAAAAP